MHCRKILQVRSARKMKLRSKRMSRDSVEEAQPSSDDRLIQYGGQQFVTPLVGF
jgi:hypothetical protein